MARIGSTQVRSNKSREAFGIIQQWMAVHSWEDFICEKFIDVSCYQLSRNLRPAHASGNASFINKTWTKLEGLSMFWSDQTESNENKAKQPNIRLTSIIVCLLVNNSEYYRTRITVIALSPLSQYWICTYLKSMALFFREFNLNFEPHQRITSTAMQFPCIVRTNSVWQKAQIPSAKQKTSATSRLSALDCSAQQCQYCPITIHTLLFS